MIDRAYPGAIKLESVSEVVANTMEKSFEALLAKTVEKVTDSLKDSIESSISHHLRNQGSLYKHIRHSDCSHDYFVQGCTEELTGSGRWGQHHGCLCSCKGRC